MAGCRATTRAKLAAPWSNLRARSGTVSRPIWVAGLSMWTTGNRRATRMAHSTSSHPQPVKPGSKDSTAKTSRRTSRLGGGAVGRRLSEGDAGPRNGRIVAGDQIDPGLEKAGAVRLHVAVEEQP